MSARWPYKGSEGGGGCYKEMKNKQNTKKNKWESKSKGYGLFYLKSDFFQEKIKMTFIACAKCVCFFFSRDIWLQMILQVNEFAKVLFYGPLF